jgi:hypothetical protein
MSDDPPLGEEQPRRPPTAAHRLAVRIAAMRFTMGKATTPEQALDDAVSFIRSAEARWPGVTKDGGIM